MEGNYGSASDDTDCFLALTEAGKLITIYDEGGIFEPLESSGQFAKAKSSLKMRQAPGKDAKVLRTLSKGTKVEVLLRGDGWTMIRCKDQTGYVMSRYLSYLNFPLSRLGGRKIPLPPVFYKKSRLSRRFCPCQERKNVV